MTATRSSRRTPTPAFRERRGAHRPQGSGFVSAVPWFFAAVAILVGIAVTSGTFGGSSSDRTTATTGTSKPRPAKATPKPAASSVAPPATATTPAGEVEQDTPVVVLNGTRRAGLAARAASTMRTDGWQVRSTGNHGSSVTSTVVYFGRSRLQVTAQAVADLLGGTVQESADFGRDAITVVLGADYAP